MRSLVCHAGVRVEYREIATLKDTPLALSCAAGEVISIETVAYLTAASGSCDADCPKEGDRRFSAGYNRCMDEFRVREACTGVRQCEVSSIEGGFLCTDGKGPLAITAAYDCLKGECHYDYSYLIKNKVNTQ